MILRYHSEEVHIRLRSLSCSTRKGEFAPMMFALRKVISTILINLFMQLVASKLCNKKYECKNMGTAITKDYICIGLVFDRCVTEFQFENCSGWKTYRFDREIRLIWQGGTRPKHEALSKTCRIMGALYINGS